MFADFSLHRRLLAGLAADGHTTPTDVQDAVIPSAIEGKDLQVCAETGSGKTLAYILPVMHRLLTEKPVGQGTRALILSPTRELADQVYKTAKRFCQLCHLDVGMICGGEEFQYQAALLRKNPEMIVATPGRLVDHIKRDSCDLADVEVFILDEADRMMDMGFADDMEMIAGACCGQHQTMLLSATLKHDGVSHMAQQWMSDPVRVTTRSVRDQHELIRQQRILADDSAHKERILVWLLANEVYEKAIIFVNKRDEVERLGDFVRRHRNDVAMLHGEMSQDERRFIMQQLRDGRRQVLVATDVAARGLDVDGVDLVINYDLARKGDEYVHRIGRTGRAGREGTAISLISPYEWNLKAAIERYLNVQMESRQITGLVANYKGPKKVKASGKAASSKKKPKVRVNGKKVAVKPKSKSSRPRKAPSSGTLMDGQGFSPIRRKKTVSSGSGKAD